MQVVIFFRLSVILILKRLLTDDNKELIFLSYQAWGHVTASRDPVGKARVRREEEAQRWAVLVHC